MAGIVIKFIFTTFFFIQLVLTSTLLQAQQAPSDAEISNYEDLLQAVSNGNYDQVKALLDQSDDVDSQDSHDRTPLIVAVHLGDHKIARLLLEHGADSNALDFQAYDLITIAAVKNDVEMINLGLQFGADPTAITSPYDGTALIAAAHLGHVETVKTLIEAGAPLDHVNNLGWTALIEAIVLGDGGESHIEIVKLLVDAGANTDLADRQGRTPVTLARQHGYSEIVSLLE